MRPITLDELPYYSPWPECMIGGGSVKYQRTRDAVIREYEEKYGVLLEAVELFSPAPERIFDAVRGMEYEDRNEVAISMGKGLYVASQREAMELSVSTLLPYLRTEAMLTGSVLDLGCGYGYLLHRLRECTKGEIRLRGGELTHAGVLLGQRLGLDISRVDFFTQSAIDYLERLPEPTVITTSFTLHQLPTAAPVVEMLSRYREKITGVVCLEPEEDYFGDGLLGLLRKRYGRLCDYSADLIRVLKERKDVAIDLIDENAIGANALLPGTVSVWNFV